MIDLRVPNFPEKGHFPESLYLLIDLLCVTFALHYQYSTEDEPMPPKKTTTLNLRVDPAIKDAIREAALNDNRSIANMIEVLIRRHCEEVGITIPDQSDLFPENPDE